MFLASQIVEFCDHEFFQREFMHICHFWSGERHSREEYIEILPFILPRSIISVPETPVDEVVKGYFL